jgi:hypothetical protein
MILIYLTWVCNIHICAVASSSKSLAKAILNGSNPTLSEPFHRNGGATQCPLRPHSRLRKASYHYMSKFIDGVAVRARNRRC